MNDNCMRILFLIVFMLAGSISYAQEDARFDTLSALNIVSKQDMLLQNVRIQIEATQAVNDLYNFKFESAELQFKWLMSKYEWHPIPYFLMGLSQWWKIMPDIDNTSYDNKFYGYMDLALEKAENLYDNGGNKVEAAFFMSAAHALKARLMSDRRQWTKAALEGRNSLKYLDEIRDNIELSPELLFGDGLYNYYSNWIPENYPLLKPVMIFFPKGDKDQGIKQLRQVAHNAFYTRTEAQLFLLHILLIHENRPMEAFTVAEYLNKTFPDNAYFHRMYARLLYTLGRYRQAEVVCRDVLAKIDSGMVGYEANSGRYAAFFLAQIHESYGRKAEAKKYYERAVSFGEEIEAYETGYYLYSLLNLAEYSYQEKKIKEARKILKQIKKYAKRSHPAHKRAREYLKKFK